MQSIRRLIITLLLFPFIIVLAGCSPWTKTGDLNMSVNGRYTIEIPKQWMSMDAEDYILISKDGPFLQYILIQHRQISKPFLHTNKRLSRRMLPQEAAEVIIDEISSDPKISNFDVLDNAPVKVDDYDGFNLLFTYNTQNGLKIKTAYYGFIAEKTFYNIRYAAVDRHYFDKDLDVFFTFLNSFHLLKKSQPKVGAFSHKPGEA